MRHIVLLTTSYPGEMPGSEAAGSFVEDFAQELSKKTRVTVIAAGLTETGTRKENLAVKRFAVPRLPLSLLNPVNPRNWLPILVTLRRGMHALATVVTLDRPDHIFALWALPCGYWARAIARREQLPYSIWALGSDIWSLGKLPFVSTLLRRVLADANRCYADGYQLKREVETLSGRDCHFLPSTRHIDVLSGNHLSHTPPYKLAFLGRWHQNKGIDLLLDALALLSHEDWLKISEIRIFGGGPLTDIVEGKSDVLTQQGKPLTLGGYLDKSQASELLQWADYLLLPSRIESIPVIFSDALKSGTPLISTPVGDLPRLHKDYQFGIMSSGANPTDFCNAIRSALNQCPRYFHEALIRARQDFDLPQIVDNFLIEASKYDSD